MSRTKLSDDDLMFSKFKLDLKTKCEIDTAPTINTWLCGS